MIMVFDLWSSFAGAEAAIYMFGNAYGWPQSAAGPAAGVDVSTAMQLGIGIGL
jgi:hypothetical protein